MAKFTKITLETMSNEEMADALKASTLSLSRRKDGTFVSFPRGMELPASAANFGIVLPKGGMIIPQMMPAEIETVLAEVRAAEKEAAKAEAEARAKAEAEARAKAEAEEARREAEAAPLRERNISRVQAVIKKLESFLGKGDRSVVGFNPFGDTNVQYALNGSNIASFEPRLKSRGNLPLEEAVDLYFLREGYTWKDEDINTLIARAETWIEEGKTLTANAAERLNKVKGIHKAEIVGLDGRLVVRFNGRYTYLHSNEWEGEELVFGSFGSFAEKFSQHVVTIQGQVWLIGGAFGQDHDVDAGEIQYFTWLGTKKSMRELRKFGSTTKNLRWLSSLERCNVEGKEYFASTKTAIEELAHDLLTGRAGFAINGIEMWRGPVEDIHEAVAAYRMIPEPIVAAARAMECSNWKMVQAIIANKAVYGYEVEEKPKVEKTTTYGRQFSRYDSFGGSRSVGISKTNFCWSKEVRRFFVKVGEFTISHLAAAETREGLIEADELTEDVQKKLDDLPELEDVRWGYLDKKEYTFYKEVCALIELTRAVQAVHG